MNKRTLFEFKSEYISILVEIYFNGDKLVIEGYDSGKRVAEAWGDSDYEYVTTIEAEDLVKVYPLMGLSEGDREGLLQAFVNKFNTNTCYSEIGEFLRSNNIKSGGFSWT